MWVLGSVTSWKPNPQLQTSVQSFCAGKLRVDYRFSSCESLNTACHDNAVVSEVVGVVESSFEHVGDCFEASMRMIWKACWRFYGELVQERKRVKMHQLPRRKNTFDDCTFAFRCFNSHDLTRDLPNSQQKHLQLASEHGVGRCLQYLLHNVPVLYDFSVFEAEYVHDAWLLSVFASQGLQHVLG